MARPREFDTDDVLEKAMQAFWSGGYAATSLADLTQAMGISKSSFYETFGSKHELFLATIERYGETAAERTVGLLENSTWAKGAIAAVFEFVIDNATAEGERRGCFINNCAVESASHDGAVASRVVECLARLESAFESAVRRGQEAGDITSDHDPQILARFLTSSLHGLIVTSKANPDKANLNDVVRVVLAALD
ncbi:MAG: TetR/AcrR family transcriptional regulator [Alphaproteobacteria bacterium]|jgi:TetR/AcrR family transcriptional repressor of nem operon